MSASFLSELCQSEGFSEGVLWAFGKDSSKGVPGTLGGHKGHIGLDQGSKLIRKQKFTTASLHDSQVNQELTSGDEQALFADSAYSNKADKRACREKNLCQRSQGLSERSPRDLSEHPLGYYGVLDKGTRKKPLSKSQSEGFSEGVLSQRDALRYGPLEKPRINVIHQYARLLNIPLHT